ncbi:Retrovirus-related Pol polyprotein from transposon TNT 1-94 [Durusdinium trenchii]|uniref:Retrovirus-related Pol polyprotein from transposon TNT 1-94 n=1 Tax=Durusdinium trenchii TaxID=1381693 RepID=A0ABP0L1A6_9DINO
MTITRTKDGVPGWNGDPATWLEFKQAARLYVASTKFEARYTCGPKIAAELTGAARTAIMGKKSSWLSEEQGTETLLQHLQKTIGEPALPEVGNFLRQYFKVLRRQKGESMTAFCVRHRDEYERMCRALARMMKEHKQEVKTSMPSSAQSAAAESVGEGNEGQGGQDDPLKEVQSSDLTQKDPWQYSWWDHQWYWQGNTNWYSYPWKASQSHSWGRQSWSNRSDTQEVEEDEQVSILPDAVLGWMLLEKSGLDTMEKSIIQGEVKGNFTLAGIENALRAHWADDTLKKRDGEGRHASLFQGEEADEDYDMPLDEAEAFYEGWTEREKAWYQEAKEDEQQAWLQMQGAKRTLKEARARQHEVKMTRKFYRSYPIGSGGRAGGQKGDREKGPCFRCGERGHHKHECPKRESAKLATLQEEEDDEAQFTYHTMDIQDTPEETDGDQSNEGEVNYYGATGSSELEPDFIFRATLSTEKAITEGKAVIDGGATRTMASVYAIEKYMEVMKGLHGTDGIKHVGVTEADRPTFGFGNSQKAKCLSTCVLKLPHEERPMQLRVHVVDEGKAPVLLSVDTLRKMGAIIDFATDEAVTRIPQYLLTRKSCDHPSLTFFQRLRTMAPKKYIPAESAANMKPHYMCGINECRAELRAAGQPVHQDLSLAEVRIAVRELRLRQGQLTMRSPGNDVMQQIKNGKKAELVEMSHNYQLPMNPKATVGELRLALRQAVMSNCSGDTTIEFGKHKGASFMEVYTIDRPYSLWAMREVETSESPDWKLMQFAQWVKKMEQTEEHLGEPASPPVTTAIYTPPVTPPKASSPAAPQGYAAQPPSETQEIKEMMQQMMFKMHTMEAELKEAKEAASSGSKTRKTSTNSGFEKIEASQGWNQQAPPEGSDVEMRPEEERPGEGEEPLSQEEKKEWEKKLRLIHGVTSHEAVAQAISIWNRREMVRGFSPFQHAMGQAPDIDGRFFRDNVKDFPVDIMETPVGEIEKHQKLRLLAEETFLKWQEKFRWGEFEEKRFTQCGVQIEQHADYSTLITDSRSVYDKLQRPYISPTGESKKIDIELLALKNAQKETGRARKTRKTRKARAFFAGSVLNRGFAARRHVAALRHRRTYAPRSEPMEEGTSSIWRMAWVGGEGL